MGRYCKATYQCQRRQTREVMVGKVGVGGSNPLRIQSMTTSSTRDAEATVEQIMRLADVGCEIARVTVQGKKEAEACEAIKNGLIQRGYDIPLVADIHFYPPAALLVADFVDKVRINPGNYADKRATFQQLEYSEASYQEALERLEVKFTPLVLKCKQLGRALRIGTNHGSLSDRVLNRYGDTPLGMVESAVEYAKVCRKHDYHDIIFSMKSSNPQVMILAYRLLAARMEELGWDYPLHLGVTEAGEGEDGRVKSAMGIGSLLLDGLGDTIRVSLTEDPWFEVDPCRRLLDYAWAHEGQGIEAFEEKHRDFAAIERRKGKIEEGVPLHRDGSVLLSVYADSLNEEKFMSAVGLEARGGLWYPTETVADAVIVEDAVTSPQGIQRLIDLQRLGVGVISRHPLAGSLALWTLSEAKEQKLLWQRTQRFSMPSYSQPPAFALVLEGEMDEDWEALDVLRPTMIIFRPRTQRLYRARKLFDYLRDRGLDVAVILSFSYCCGDEDLVIQGAADCGALLCDGLGDGICFMGRHGLGLRRRLGFQILQGARMRTFKTEFISCPSCGRTLFDLQEVSRLIRARTGHLPGVKIAVMGCIVNGPGEMADADFGYVGSAAGKIDLYVGKACVEKNIPAAEGPDRLVELLKRHQRWVEPLSKVVDPSGLRDFSEVIDPT